MDVLIDIETIPQGATLGMDLSEETGTAPGWAPTPPDVAPPRYDKRFTDPEKVAADKRKKDKSYQSAVESDLRRQRLDALHDFRRGSLRWADVRIVAIGITDGERGRVFASGDESRDLADLIEAIPASGRVITFGDYDARMIRSRMLYYGIPFGPFSTGAKPWERRIVDLQRIAAEVLEGYPSKIKGISVDALCEHLRIWRADNPISGREVLDAWVGGRLEDIVAHCHADIRDEWQIWSILRDLGAV